MPTPLLIILTAILIIYPFIVSKTICKNTKQNDESNSKRLILKNILKILLYSSLSLIIIEFLLDSYSNLIPSTKSDLCINNGGWIYSCKVNDHKIPILLLMMGIVITIHHFICQKFVYEIFKYTKNISKYIFMYCYMILVYILNFFLTLNLYGLFISIHFDLAIVEILRMIINFLPTTLFIISTFIYSLKNKQKD